MAHSLGSRFPGVRCSTLMKTSRGNKAVRYLRKLAGITYRKPLQHTHAILFLDSRKVDEHLFRDLGSY